ARPARKIAARETILFREAASRAGKPRLARAQAAVKRAGRDFVIPFGPGTLYTARAFLGAEAPPIGMDRHMRSNVLRGFALSALAGLALTACASPNSGNVVSANQAQVAQSVTFGTITGSRPVTVQGGNKTGE